MAGTKDYEPYVAQGGTFAHLIAIVRDMNYVSVNGKFREETLSIPQAQTALRNATGNDELKFQTCTIEDLKTAFFLPETPEAVIEQARGEMAKYEKAIEAVQTEAAGLPSENS